MHAEPVSKTKYHIGCMIYDNAIADERLLQSELTCALGLIRHHMRLEVNVAHLIVPVGFKCLRCPI